MAPMDDAKNGKRRFLLKRMLPIGITAAERVCSGAHYAGFFSTMSAHLNNPELLEVPPETVRYDPKVEYHEPKPCQRPAAAGQTSVTA